MPTKFLTTGQAAERCAVTPDAVLRWIRSGRLTARRTAGGHHRIDARDLERLMEGSEARARNHALTQVGARHFRYCWEYNWEGGLHENCSECIVYRLRAQRCYEMANLAPDVRPSMTFCDSSCEDCDYYRHVQAERTNVLVVTDDKKAHAALEQGPAAEGFNLQITDCEYTCSLLVDTFRPDFVVVDCSLGPDMASDMRYHLAEDPRIPFVRIILAAGEDDATDACRDEVFAILDKPFQVEDISECIRGVPSGGGD